MSKIPPSRPHILSMIYGSWNIVVVKQTCSLKFNHGGKLDGELLSRAALAAGKINPCAEASPSGMSLASSSKMVEGVILL